MIIISDRLLKGTLLAHVEIITSVSHCVAILLQVIRTALQQHLGIDDIWVIDQA